MRCHTGNISFGSVLLVYVIFAENTVFPMSYLHGAIMQLQIYLNMDNAIDHRFRKCS